MFIDLPNYRRPEIKHDRVGSPRLVSKGEQDGCGPPGSAVSDSVVLDVLGVRGGAKRARPVAARNNSTTTKKHIYIYTQIRTYIHIYTHMYTQIYGSDLRMYTVTSVGRGHQACEFCVQPKRNLKR